MRDQHRGQEPQVKENSVIFAAPNGRLYEINLSLMIQTKIGSSQHKHRRVLRHEVQPAIYVWESAVNKYKPYDPIVCSLCEIVWQRLHSPTKKEDTEEKVSNIFKNAEEHLDEVESAIRNRSQLDYLSFAILKFKNSENTLCMLKLFEEYEFTVDHIRICLIEGVSVEVVRYIMDNNPVELCGKILFPHNSHYKLNSKAVRQSLDSLKFLLSFGCNFSEDCWKKGSRFMKMLSRECFHSFLVRLLNKRKFGGQVNSLVMAYYHSIDTKDDSHNLYKAVKSKKRKNKSSIPNSPYSPQPKAKTSVQTSPLTLSIDPKEKRSPILKGKESDPSITQSLDETSPKLEPSLEASREVKKVRFNMKDGKKSKRKAEKKNEMKSSKERKRINKQFKRERRKQVKADKRKEREALKEEAIKRKANKSKRKNSKRRFSNKELHTQSLH